MAFRAASVVVLVACALVSAGGCGDDGGLGGSTSTGETEGSSGSSGPTSGPSTSSPSTSDPSSSEGSSEGSSGGGSSEGGSVSTGGASEDSSGGSSEGSGSGSGSTDASSSDTGTAACDCAANQYCDWPDDACGEGEAGSCTVRPMGCPDVYDPVCGCDGQTYGNDCDAAAAGIDVDYAGECEVAVACECEDGQYCVLPIGECDSDEGVCEDIPNVACPEIYAPVCGCDGMTYSSDCVAANAGMNIDYEGEC